MTMRLPVFAFLMIVLLPGVCLADDGYPHGLSTTQHHHIASETLERGFGLYVLLPDDYEEESGRQYPTLYVLDGGLLYPLLAGYYQYLSIGGEAPALIMVGISYPGIGFKNGNYRSTDFTAPSKERDHYGGAVRFQKFLRDELFPLIESRYRSQSDRRIVFGHSLGGQFVLHTAQTEPSLFWGYISSNPALHRNLDFFLHTKPQASSNAGVFVASGTLDDPDYRVPAKAWIDHWSRLKNKPWRLKTIHADGHTHMSLPPVAFRQGLQWLFDN